MQRPDELVGSPEDESGLLDGFMVTDLSLDNLEEEQLVEGEAAARGLYCAQGRGLVRDRRRHPRKRSGRSP